MNSKNDIARLRRRKRRRQNIIRTAVQALVWLGVAVLYYFGFSIFFDTPLEYSMKHAADPMRREYEALTARYDSLSMVLDNLSERDRNLFHSLFEAEPYDFDTEEADSRADAYEQMLDRSTRQLKRELRRKADNMEQRMEQLAESYLRLQEQIDFTGEGCDNIPAIQPVINKQLTLLTASYGMRIHPFFKTLQSHQGVDYSVPEGSRVFATADGVVTMAQRHSTKGRTIVIDHGNGFETHYSHLLMTNVQKGDRVQRGEIIGLSGNSGLSLAPHLHYEIHHNGMRVDPIHYFFMELTPTEYQRIQRIAESGMQSFD